MTSGSFSAAVHLAVEVPHPTFPLQIGPLSSEGTGWSPTPSLTLARPRPSRLREERSPRMSRPRNGAPGGARLAKANIQGTGVPWNQSCRASGRGLERDAGQRGDPGARRATIAPGTSGFTG